ncbi:transporter [Saccharibacter sp. 17.LH.SD]|uniref:ComEC/Rec2 family competence protein n=1 Tax=Saccharibacter sp. 17.LH.SD TaxID=2689393 RepID=UPI0013697D1A|nr:ComEC/Rec2 family competence protein [Saccharibacter sp. 17.LH.SD]MXV43841.1 transporter [Saccharibacter sp. 17.LH.SD]
MFWGRWIEQSLFRQGRRLFCWVPVAMGAGIAAYFALLSEPSFLFKCVVAIMAFGGVVVCVLARPRFPYALTARALGIALVSVSVGFLDVAVQAQRQPPIMRLPQQAVWVEGQIQHVERLPPREYVEDKDPRYRVVLRHVRLESVEGVEALPLKRVIRITLKKGEKTLPISGEAIRLRALLRQPSMPSWPYGRDLQREDWFNGLAGSGMALSFFQVITLGQGVFWGHWREVLAARILRELPGQNGAIAATLLCGETGALSSQTRRDFSASGLAHLLAVAGLHLGFVMGACYFVLRRGLAFSEKASLFWSCREIAVIGSLLCGGIYIWLTGEHLPGLRALGMASYGVLALLFGRRVLSLRALALVALGMELWCPAVILDVSFQMSFAAVLVLIVGYDFLCPYLEKLRQKSLVWERWGVPFLMLGLTSLLAGMATLPISMAHFGAFQPWFVVANLVAVPITGMWVMPMGLLSLILSPFGLDTAALWAMSWGIKVIRLTARMMAHAPWASCAVPSWPGWGVFLVMVGLTMVCLWQGKGRWMGGVILSVGVGVAWIVPRPVLLLAPDAQAIALHIEGNWFIGAPKADVFIRNAWQQDMGIKAHMLSEICPTGLCRLSLSRQTVLIDWGAHDEKIMRGDESLCRDVMLVVSREDRRALCQTAQHLNGAMARKEGAWAVYGQYDGHFSLISDQTARGARLWVPHMGYVDVINLPMAKEE